LPEIKKWWWIINILLAVHGIFPSILTETIYALKKHKQVNIDEIYVITTLKGREQILSKLLDKTYGYFYKCCKELKISPSFPPENIIVPEVGEQPLNDIKSFNDSIAAANTIFNTLKQIAANRTNEYTIHASITGGRKTMSIYLYIAMMMYGKPNDKIYHVFVDDIAERHDEFYFPENKMLEVHRNNGQKIFFNANQVEIEISEIPVIVLSEVLDQNTYANTIAHILSAVSLSNVEKLHIDLINANIIFNEKVISLTPANLAFYATLAEYRKNSLCEQDCPGCEKCFVNVYHFLEPENFDKFLNNLEVIYGTESGHFGRMLKRKNEGTFFADKDFREYVSKVNNVLKKGIYPYKNILIASLDIGGTNFYGLHFPKKDISILK